jgi:ribosomal biogenesis protein LAS1
MQGAFTVWDKLLYKLSKHQPGFLNILITRMIETIIERSNTIDNEPIKEALYEWVLHILTGQPWASLATPVRQKHTENALAQCLASVTSRTTKLAKEVLETQNADFFRDWAPIVKIALEGSPDSVTDGSAALILENAPSKASRAPREVMVETPSQDALYRSQDAHGEDPELRIGWVKYRGLWPRTAIGALPSENEWHKRATISALWEGAGNQAAEWEAMSGDEEGGSLQTMMNGKTRGMRV